MSKEGRWALGGLTILAIWTLVALPFLKWWPFDRPFWAKALEDPVACFTLWVAGFTAVLALSTILLWFATRTAAIAAKYSAEVAEKALVSLEAPFISIKIVAPGIVRMPGRHNFETLSFRVVNYGRTPARVLSFSTESCLCQKRMNFLRRLPLLRGGIQCRGALLRRQPTSPNYSTQISLRHLFRMLNPILFL
jgi:hypothetical protein